MHQLLAEAWDRLSPGSGYSLEVSLNQGNFRTDRSLFSILVGKVLENAIHFSNPAGHNKVSVKGVVLPSSLTLEICDAGEEIPEEIADKIFDMFYRGSARARGQGLGLYSAKRIAERFQGTIHLVNERPLKKFVITIPVMQTH